MPRASIAFIIMSVYVQMQLNDPLRVLVEMSRVLNSVSLEDISDSLR